MLLANRKKKHLRRERNPQLSLLDCKDFDVVDVLGMDVVYELVSDSSPTLPDWSVHLLDTYGRPPDYRE